MTLMSNLPASRRVRMAMRIPMTEQQLAQAALEMEMFKMAVAQAKENQK